MDRNESTNEGGSSPDTVIARSSSEEEKQKLTAGSTSGEYVTVGDSSSSLDTLTSGSGGVAIPSAGTADDKKRGKFGAFKSSLRESGLFKIKKKPRESDVSVDAEDEKDDKGNARKQTEGDKNYAPPGYSITFAFRRARGMRQTDQSYFLYPIFFSEFIYTFLIFVWRLE